MFTSFLVTNKSFLFIFSQKSCQKWSRSSFFQIETVHSVYFLIPFTVTEQFPPWSDSGEGKKSLSADRNLEHSETPGGRPSAVTRWHGHGYEICMAGEKLVKFERRSGINSTQDAEIVPQPLPPTVQSFQCAELCSYFIWGVQRKGLVWPGPQIWNTITIVICVFRVHSSEKNDPNVAVLVIPSHI